MVVGRNMTKDNLKAALKPLLTATSSTSRSEEASTSSSSSGGGGSSNASSESKGANEAARKAEVQAYMHAATKWSQSSAAARAEDLGAEVVREGSSSSSSSNEAMVEGAGAVG